VAEPPGRLHLSQQSDLTFRGKCRPITILSANLWHDWPRHRNTIGRLEYFARLVEAQRADIILLQEVMRRPGLWADQWLSQRLGMGHIYSRVNGHTSAIGFEEGLAVFSRFPIHAWHLRQLDSYAIPFVRRLALGATVDTPCGKILAVSVHLGIASRQNANQLALLRSWIDEVSADLPVTIGGDFNSHETSPQISQLKSAWIDTFRSLHPQGDGTSHVLRWPWGGTLRRSRLDYIFLKPGRTGLDIQEARYLQVPRFPHSDHHAVLTRLATVESATFVRRG
jgi:endonuclease/exonuclease/phosphatase family metal-dependent hydrolase